MPSNTTPGHPGTVTITLTADRRARATLRARRSAQAARGQTKFEPGRGYDLTNRHLHGAGAREALAQWLGVRSVPDGLDTFCTPNASGGLILRREQTKGRWVLVTGTMPTYVLRGWSSPAEIIERGEWWKKYPPGGWYMPADELHAMIELTECWGTEASGGERT